jgi:nucleotide-binding universal stress UspA family protein
MKSIIIPTDFSDISRNSINYGFELASRLGFKIQLVHVLELYKFAAGTSETEILSTILPADSIKEMQETAEVSFKKLIDDLKEQFGNKVDFEHKIIPGHLVNEMIAEAADDDTEMILLAVAETQDLVTRFTQGTISAIVAEASCPVMVVPSKVVFTPCSRILYATDFNKADINALLHCINTFEKFNPHITVLHISTKASDFKTELKFAGFKQMILESTSFKNIDFKLTQNKQVVNGIVQEILTDQADILVMLKEHEGFFRSLFETSKTDKITHLLKIPMISYHEQSSGVQGKIN